MNIRDELAENRSIVASWLPRHRAQAVRVRELRSDVSRYGTLVEHDQLRLDRVLGQSLLETMVRSTAWDAAKATGLVRNFDVATTAVFADVSVPGPFICLC